MKNYIKMIRFKISRKIIVSISAILIILFFIFNTHSVSGKMLLMDSEPFSNDRIVTFRTNESKLLKLFFYDKTGIKLFDNEPKKILLKSGGSSIEVSLDKFLSDVTSGTGDFPADGVDVAIKYNPNFPKKFLWINRLDGDIKEVTYEVSKPALGNNQFFTLSETSRDSKKYVVNYSYSFKVAPPDVWYYMNGENGEVTTYLKDGERFIKSTSYSFGSPEIKFLEEFKQNQNSCLLNFQVNPSNTFQLTFSTKEKMIQNSFLLEESLKSQVINAIQK